MNDTIYKTYMTDAMGPLPFCPGCGHGVMVKALDKALVKLQKDPKNVVIVTDIGCVGLSDRYFETNAFHGLHGRSITYACGLKLARPELTVIAIQGDGGCGIGGTHLLNVARRNIGITLIVSNNFNYGMTGGQHSVTTPTSGITSTTPHGNVEGPMDICGTVAAAGAAWVYRTNMFDKDLSDIMAKAIEQPGFAMLDIWELCTAYFAPRNNVKKTELLDMADKLGFKMGLVTDKPRPEYSAHYKESYEKDKRIVKNKPPIEKQFDHSIKKQTEIVIVGSAGQKIKSSATIFAQAAMFCGLEATQKDDYPITVMTGHSVAELILSPERIEYTAIDNPDYYIVLSEEGANRVKDKIVKLPETCTIVVDNSVPLPETKAKILKLPINETAKTVDKKSIAAVALGAMLKDSGMFPPKAFESALYAFQKKAIAENNVRAVQAGAGIEIG
jgi:2-oxoglutarate/2-oxoacid ferredoxin oxidoreductase subunit beta